MKKEEVFEYVKKLYDKAGKLPREWVERHNVIEGLARYASESEGLSEEDVVREVETFLAEEEDEEE